MLNRQVVKSESATIKHWHSELEFRILMRTWETVPP
ncbi:hypothetical protein CK203_016329 [Vitis vinifera]|uniref:Uncharacterized protein n=1 Tax=Vitis vinifera TaxID=29760 RepID=A0A438J1C5_VITVI|nr:hypothetical protein CK203_016329 [Vitis vinifera]